MMPASEEYKKQWEGRIKERRDEPILWPWSLACYLMIAILLMILF